MSLNWMALLLVLIAVFAVVMGIKGTYPQVWAQLKTLTRPQGGEQVAPTRPPEPPAPPHPGAGGTPE